MLIPSGDTSLLWSIASCLKFNYQRTTYFQSLQGTPVTSMDRNPRPGPLIPSLKGFQLHLAASPSNKMMLYPSQGCSRSKMKQIQKCFKRTLQTQAIIIWKNINGSFCYSSTLPNKVVNETRHGWKRISQRKNSQSAKSLGNSCLTMVLTQSSQGCYLFPKQCWCKRYNEMRSMRADSSRQDWEKSKR